MKRLIYCLDGTWNNRDATTPTNVAKLHKVVATTGTDGVCQVARYLEGIASTKGKCFPFLKGSLGIGVAERIQSSYMQLVEDYAPGDEIYLFGFSRGGFEARRLAGLIALLGISRSSGPAVAATAWALFRTTPAKRDPALIQRFREDAHTPVRIKCVGVWDTVGGIANPLFSGGLVSRRHAFHDTHLADSVDVGLQALSIDEKRGPFRPTLWTVPSGHLLPANQHIEQVWFAGTHADVGGGWRECQLADVALLWMTERVEALTSLTFDKDKLAAATRPDPLGPQHASATSRAFAWSRLLPFIRLISQKRAAIPSWRRSLLGTWRSSVLPGTESAVNESIHDSVGKRFGQAVIELEADRGRQIEYKPRSLVVLPLDPQPAPNPVSGRLRRVKIFTVHGTFAHDTNWDNWDAADDPARPTSERAFVNKLSQQLRERGVKFERIDHSEYNWSGGNSHDERRAAAIGLKRHIEAEIETATKVHGPDHYDGVYIIAHSHGGTISRLAMNLWDKDDAYYDPIKTHDFDEAKHDDTCPHCMRIRNGSFGPARVPRPDGVFTFGSPFVTFEKRPGGLQAARVAAWTFRLLAAIPLALIFAIAWHLGAAYGTMATVWGFVPTVLKPIVLLLGPLVLFWLFSTYLRKVPAVIEAAFGKGPLLFGLSATGRLLKWLGLTALVAYYIAWWGGKLPLAFAWWPPTNEMIKQGIGWAALAVVTFLVVVAVPGSFLTWLEQKVAGLGSRLPKKYDPAADRVVSYVSYHTPGDEAGIHLRLFGLLTWVVQALVLAAISVLTFGLAIMLLVTVEGLLGFFDGGTILGRIGISPSSDFPEVRDRYIALIDWLGAYPRLVWSQLFGIQWLPPLAHLDDARQVTWYVPIALVLTILGLFLLLMPVALVALAIVYLLTIWLRGTGVVFGGESPAWTLANQITITRRPNDNTVLRLIFISPEAWWRREIAHSFYYKSDRVIADVAATIGDWARHAPTSRPKIGASPSALARWLVVALFVLSIFAISVPVAGFVASAVRDATHAINEVLGLDVGKVIDNPGALPDPKDAAAFTKRGAAFMRVGHPDRAIADFGRAIELEPASPEHYVRRANAFAAKRDHARALADFATAIEIAPASAATYANRAALHLARGDFEAALADHTKAIELEPTKAVHYFQRGHTHDLRGNVEPAIADHAKAVELSPDYTDALLALGFARFQAGEFKAAAEDAKLGIARDHSLYSPYFVLLRYLARMRAGETSAAAELEAWLTAQKGALWPRHLHQLMLDRLTPAAALAAARTEDERCEARFYIGEWYLLKGDADEAKKSLQQTLVDNCKSQIEYRIALAELKRLP